jgi:TPR repeat protein
VRIVFFVLAFITLVSFRADAAGTNTAAQASMASQIFQQAQAGSPAAQYQLGLMLLSGQGVKADRAKAALWLKRSADQGSDAAAFVLAKLIYQDAGKTGANIAPGGKTAAYFWAVIAANNGSKERIALREQIESEVAPDLAEVQKKRALNWKPKLEQLQFTMPATKKPAQ